MSGVEVRVCGRYRLQSIFKKGEVHTLYVARNVQTQQQVIIKAEESKLKNTNMYSLLQEGKILQSIQGGIGVPSMHWCGQEEDYNFIVMQYLGKNLQELFEMCNRKFSLKTVLMIGSQIINILQYFHFKNYVHKCVKPANFLIGTGKKNHKLFIVDYSMTRRYRDNKTLQHNPYKEYGSVSDNNQFSSLNANTGSEYSRRDDIESLLLMMVYFLKGKLPWHCNKDPNESEDTKNKRMLLIKKNISIEELCKGLPKQFSRLLKYCRQLKFDQKPDYTYIKNIFRERMDRQGMLDDYIFDWVLLPPPISQQNFQNYIPISIEIIPNEEEFIKTHFELYNKQLQEAENNQNKIEKKEFKQAQPKEKEIKVDKVQVAKTKKQKECIIF